MKFKKILIFLIAFFAALVIFFVKERVGMAVITFLLIDLFLNEDIKFNIKTLIYAILAVVLFIIGRFLSMRLAMLYCRLIGAYAGGEIFTFKYGFFCGIIEMGTYLCFTLFIFKLATSRKFADSLRYALIVILIWTLIGGLIQGAYNAGWQNKFCI